MLGAGSNINKDNADAATPNDDTNTSATTNTQRSEQNQYQPNKINILPEQPVQPNTDPNDIVVKLDNSEKEPADITFTKTINHNITNNKVQEDCEYRMLTYHDKPTQLQSKEDK